MIVRALLLCVIAGVLAGCAESGAPGTQKITLAVIPKGTSHVFWQSVHAGARRGAREAGVDIVWRGPLREDDRDAQISEVENAVGRRVSGIALAPLDEAALVAPGGERAEARHPGRDLRLRASRATTSSASSPPTTTSAGSWPASIWRRSSAARAR